MGSVRKITPFIWFLIILLLGIVASIVFAQKDEFFIPTLIFGSINLLAFLAVLVNVSRHKEDLKTEERESNTWSKILAWTLLVSSFLLVVLFPILLSFLAKLGNNIYLGYLITSLAFFFPFISQTHNDKKAHWSEINFVGWLTIIIGFSGLLSSILRMLGGVSDYISLISNFIGVTSAMVALSGQTISSRVVFNEEGKERTITELTDLGKLALFVILLGFGISVFNAKLQDAEKSEADEQRIITLKNLKKANADLQSLSDKTITNFNRLNDTLKSGNKIMDEFRASFLRNSSQLDDLIKGNQEELFKELEKVNKELRKEIEDFKDKIVQDIKKTEDDLGNQLAALDKSVAKKAELDQLEALTNTSIANINTMKSEIGKIKDIETNLSQMNTALNQSKQRVLEVSQSVASMKSVVDYLNSKLGSGTLATNADIKALIDKLTALSAKVDAIKPNTVEEKK